MQKKAGEEKREQKYRRQKTKSKIADKSNFSSNIKHGWINESKGRAHQTELKHQVQRYGSRGRTLQIQRHKLTESKRMEKHMSRGQQPHAS